DPAPLGQDEVIQGGTPTTSCTVAFAFTYSGGNGFATAGHCNDTQTADGQTATVLSGYQACTPSDYQLMGHVSNVGNAVTVQNPPPPEVPVAAVAGGFNQHQTVYIYRKSGPASVGEAIGYA